MQTFSAAKKELDRLQAEVGAQDMNCVIKTRKDETDEQWQALKDEAEKDTKHYHFVQFV